MSPRNSRKAPKRNIFHKSSPGQCEVLLSRHGPFRDGIFEWRLKNIDLRFQKWPVISIKGQLRTIKPTYYSCLSSWVEFRWNRMQRRIYSLGWNFMDDVVVWSPVRWSYDFHELSQLRQKIPPARFLLVPKLHLGTNLLRVKDIYLQNTGYKVQLCNQWEATFAKVFFLSQSSSLPAMEWSTTARTMYKVIGLPFLISRKKIIV